MTASDQILSILTDMSERVGRIDERTEASARWQPTVDSRLESLEARPTITSEQHEWIAEQQRRAAEAPAHRVNRRNVILAGTGLSLTAFGSLMTYGHVVYAAISRALGGH